MDKTDLDEAILTNSESHTHPTEAAEKKKFVTPEISVPVDVLEATTFFQLTDSGTT